jgi:hypothetical protein
MFELRTRGGTRRGARLVSGIAGILILCISQNVGAQVRGGWQPLSRINPGATVAVRTSEPISVNTADGRVFTGVVDQDLIDENGRLAIPRGSGVELMVRRTPNNELALDLESVVVNGQRYAIAANENIVGTAGSLGGLGTNRQTAEYVGGGALLGTIIGAIAGGGKGAAIGAAVGAAAGAGSQVVTRGSNVTVPAESLLTYRLERELTLGVPDTGFTRPGGHYHAFNQVGGQAGDDFRSTTIVPGNQPWTPTNILVRTGDVLRFQVAGEVESSANSYDRARAQGSRSRQTVSGPPLPYQPRGALIARIDNGEPFLVANQSAVRMPADGTLFLGINDTEMFNNRGQYNVEITR